MLRYLLRFARLLRCLLAAGWMLAGLPSLPAAAQAPLSLPALDSVVAQARRASQVPGVAVAVVQEGRLVLAQGYGVRSLATQEPVDAHTLFDIGSVTQSFTAAALRLLVAQGQLGWNDCLADYLPELLPMVAHPPPSWLVAGGLAHPYAGMFADPPADPEPAAWLALGPPPRRPAATVRALVADARYLCPATPLDFGAPPDGSRYQLAGELLARATGRPWPELVAARLLGPLGLRRSGPYLQLPDPTNVAAAHAWVRGHVRVVPRHFSLADDPAGSFYSSAADLSRWVGQWLSSPGWPAPLACAVAQPAAGSRPVVAEARGPAPVVAAYGLAWSCRTARGYQVLTHQSSSQGMQVRLVLLPELRLGIIVLANQEAAEAALATISGCVLRGYLPPVPAQLPAPAAGPATAHR